MDKSLESVIKGFYHRLSTEEFSNPSIIDGYGASDKFPWAPYGWSHYATFHLLHETLANMRGDILEIGAHEGTFTTILAAFAKTCRKKVHVIDPWEGTQQGGEKQFVTWYNRMIDERHVIYNRERSQSTAALNAINKMHLCFAWIDGLHTYEACSQDIANVKNAFNGPGIIGIDDVRGEFGFNPMLMRAAREAEDDVWKHIESPDDGIFTFLVREE
jgi:hypothetical protein